MTYRVRIVPQALKVLDKLSDPARTKIRERIRTLAEQPRPHGSQKLKGLPYWRIRVGDYRVVYRIEDDVLVVLVVRVGHRKDVYRGME